MSAYIFNAYGVSKVIYKSDIETIRSQEMIDDYATDLSVAMMDANRSLLWTYPDAREGTWTLDCEITSSYVWKEDAIMRFLRS